MASPFLGISHILPNTNDAKVPVNEAIDALDRAVNGILEVDLTAADATLTEAQVKENYLLILTGTPGTTRTVTFPANQRIIFVQNTSDSVADLRYTGQTPDVSLGVASSAGIAVNPATMSIVELMSGSGGGGGGSIIIQDEGIQLTAAASLLNFVGPGVQAFINSDGTVDVSVPEPTVLVSDLRPSVSVVTEANTDLALGSENTFHFARGTGPQTFTLPAALTAPDGWSTTIKRDTAQTVQIVADTGVNLEGTTAGTSFITAEDDTVTIIAEGGAFFLIGGFDPVV